MHGAGATVREAVQAAVAVAASHGVRSDDPLVLADGANVVVHLRPAPIVAKVAATTHLVRDPRPWLGRELPLSAHIAASGLAVVRPSDLLPPRVHELGAAVLTFWRHEPHDPMSLVGAVRLGSMLRDIHDALRCYPVALPRLATPFEDIGNWLERAGATAPRQMRPRYDWLRAELAGNDGQALHGDPHPGNVLMTPRGPVWADLEDACRGPVAWDLACLAESSRLDGAAALRAYGDVPDLTSWRELRRLHATVWTALYAERLERHRPRARELLTSWD